jgi:uncharacterized protein YjbJ (UPF0337 family)
VEELLNQSMSKAGLSADQAKSALTVVMGFMKDKLPADLMNQISGVFRDMDNMLGDAAGAVGDAASDAAGAATGAAGTAAGAAGDAAGAAKDAGSGLVDGIMKTFGG